MFTEIQKDEAKYERFVNNFGRYIKVGVIEDQDNKDALLKLATFSSSSSDDKRASHYPTCLLPTPLLPSSHQPTPLRSPASCLGFFAGYDTAGVCRAHEGGAEADLLRLRKFQSSRITVAGELRSIPFLNTRNHLIRGDPHHLRLMQSLNGRPILSQTDAIHLSRVDHAMSERTSSPSKMR